MSVKIILLFCAQALLVQMVLSQCTSPAAVVASPGIPASPYGLAGPGLYNGLAPYGLAGAGLYNGLAGAYGLGAGWYNGLAPFASSALGLASPLGYNTLGCNNAYGYLI